MKACLNCSKQVVDDAPFCKYCGYSFTQATNPTLPTAVSEPPAPPPIFPIIPSPMPAAPSRVQPSNAQAPTAQLNASGDALLSIWGPFAGRGSRGQHATWLLNELGDRAEQLVTAVTQRFDQRQIPKARIDHKLLTVQGLLVEKRPYYVITRGLTTVGLFVGRFGRDLFVSQVTYYIGRIDPFRVLVAGLLVCLMVLPFIAYQSGVNGISNLLTPSVLGGSGGSGFNTIWVQLACCLSPFSLLAYLVMPVAILLSIGRFLSENNLLFLLRTPPNEFQLDDIIALQKAVEETVRQSLDMVGIDKALFPEGTDYGFRQRLI